MSTRHDEGIATVWAATAVGVVVTVTALALYLGGAIAARHRAGSAADLAALAAAGLSVFGADVACERAAGIAAAMDAQLVGCALDGWDALVEVRVDVPMPELVSNSLVAVGRARAGPPVEPGATDATRATIPHQPLETAEVTFHRLPSPSTAAGPPTRAAPPAARSRGGREPLRHVAAASRGSPAHRGGARPVTGRPRSSRDAPVEVRVDATMPRPWPSGEPEQA